MLYLAQIQQDVNSGDTFLHLLACQRAEHAWTVLDEDALVLPVDLGSFANGPTPLDAGSPNFDPPSGAGKTSSASRYGNGSLVLADITDSLTITRLDNAKDWLLEILQQFLITGITPEFLQQETERAEQWRQSLTLQSQELDRRTLELEARREQIQVLEEVLKREKKVLSSQNEELERRKQDLLGEERLMLERSRDSHENGFDSEPFEAEHNKQLESELKT
jgi:hypothetical protein